MKQQKEVKSKTVFRDDKHALLTVAVIVLVALVALNFTKITGNTIADTPSSLSVFQDGKRVTVQVNYPAGKYGRSNSVIDLESDYGAKRDSMNTKCDTDYGYVAQGNSKCVREIAVFNLAGDEWKSGDRVTFSVEKTNVKRSYIIR
jgi:hypothetical protein